MERLNSNLVHGFRKAIKIVDGIVAVGDEIDGGKRSFPMTRNDENGIGCGRQHLLLPRLQKMPRWKTLVYRQRR